MGFGAIGPAERGNQIGCNFSRFVDHFGYVSSVGFFYNAALFISVKKSHWYRCRAI